MKTFLVLCLLATSAFAQEFGREAGGTLDLITKHAQPFSGSFAISKSQFPFTFDATLGGTLVRDRVWFFAAAERSRSRFSSSNVQLGDSQNLAASFTQQSQPVMIPSSFLSLHYTGIVSDNMFFTTTFSQIRRSQ